MASGEEPRSTRKRDLVVGLLGVLALLGVGWAALDFVGSREDPAPPDPAAAAARFAEAWIDRDVDAMHAVLVRLPGEELIEGWEAFDTLEPTDFRVSVGEVEPGDEEGFATVFIEPELDVPGIGTWAWTSALQMERGRGSWRVRWDFTSFHPSLADGLHFETRVGPASRAPILGVDGTPLTSTGEVVTIGIEPSRVPSAERLADSLASLVPEAIEPLEKVFARPDLVPTWFYPLVTVPAERIAGIRDRVDTLPGVILRSTDGRVGTSAGFGRHVLGQVVDADAQLAEERGVPVGTPVGRGGLEEDFDDQLRGSEVTEIVAVESDGDVRASVATFSDDLAESVRTTLDAVIQEAMENALVGQQDRIAIVAVGPDGGVLGAASRPLNGYNRAFVGNYAPGAGVWGMTLLAALENGASAEDLVECPGEAVIGGVSFRNLTDFDLGTVTVQEAIANGCRSSIALLASQLPIGTLPALAEDFGFNAPGEADLGYPVPSWPRPRDVAEQAASGVGQAQLLAPVVHLAAIAATFVDGSFDPPHVLLDPEAVLDEAGAETATPRLGVAKDRARAIMERAGAQAGLGPGVGLVAGEGASAEGNLGWASLVTDEFGMVVLVEGGTRADAIGLVDRFLAERRGLRG